MNRPKDNNAELTARFLAGCAGDAVQYSLFLQALSVLLRRIMGKRLPAHDVEDVVQEVLISVHKARHTYDGQRPLMPWLLAIAAFRINDYFRKRYAHEQREIAVESLEEIMVEDVTKSLVETESLDELLQYVPERQRRILTMIYVDGYTTKETAQKLNMKESAVKVAAHRAIKKIREGLGA